MNYENLSLCELSDALMAKTKRKPANDAFCVLPEALAVLKAQCSEKIIPKIFISIVVGAVFAHFYPEIIS